jgi:hypothetical protein
MDIRYTSIIKLQYKSYLYISHMDKHAVPVVIAVPVPVAVIVGGGEVIGTEVVVTGTAIVVTEISNSTG